MARALEQDEPEPEKEEKFTDQEMKIEYAKIRREEIRQNMLDGAHVLTVPEQVTMISTEWDGYTLAHK